MKNIIGALASIASFVFFGCGGTEVLLHPNYSQEEIRTHKISDMNVRVVKVVDRRSVDPRTMGTARVGMMNTLVPYHSEVQVSEFVKNVYDSLFVDSTGKAVTAVAYIDSFRVREGQSLFSETGLMNARISFGVRMSHDSVAVISTSAEETASSAIDVTDMLEPLIYKATVECGLQFADRLRTIGASNLLTTADSSGVLVNEPILSQSQPLIEPIRRRSPFTEFHDIGFSYGAGGKITSDVRFFGNIMTQKDSSRTMTGFGANLEILDVTNKSNMIQGTIVGLGGNLVLRQMLTDSKNPPYLGITGALIFGNETIDYVTSKETEFFFGPLVRETLGITIDRKFFIEGGAYEILLAGSKMLPSDAGFTVGMSFGI